MRQKAVVYNSADNKTKVVASNYSKTHQTPHRYLAYRDIPKFIRQFVKGRRALDFGAGTGASAEFLYNLGLDVIGLDVSSNMLAEARSNFPYIEFYHVNDLPIHADFDCVFSSFVLLELATKQEIIQYLNQSLSFLKENGIFIGITGSEHLYSLSREWMMFKVNFEENKNLRSGDTVKLTLKYPEMEFYDYYWKETDYLDCFKKVNLEILQIYFPLGFPKEPYPWKDEITYSPFIVFIARKIGYSSIASKLS